MIEQTSKRPREMSQETLPSRLVSWIVGLALGVLFGAMGTAVSQSTWTVVPGFSVPIGLLVALPAVALLLIGLRRVLRTRTAAVIAAFGMVVTVFLLSQPSTGGSVLVPANALGFTWTFAPTVIALLVLAWPRFSRK